MPCVETAWQGTESQGVSAVHSPRDSRAAAGSRISSWGLTGYNSPPLCNHASALVVPGLLLLLVNHCCVPALLLPLSLSLSLLLPLLLSLLPPPPQAPA